MKKLTPEEKHIIIEKGTERPFSGSLVYNKEDGIYRCKLCGSPLFKSKSKFESECGWPSFDDAIKGAIREIPEADGRKEIICAKCGGHLGHVFRGEKMTQKNTRYCVNSLSLTFDKKDTYSPKDIHTSNEKIAYFAGGCFWRMEYYLEKLDGVKDVISGYMGGTRENPTYKDVSSGNTGYLEVVKVIYDPAKISYETLAKAFFEIHDPTQANGQGPDIGEQYQSAVFASNAKEKEIINNLISILKQKGYKVVTKIYDVKSFYKAEDYHQNYYAKHNKTPYCHGYIKRF
ncbi:MAG: bifunctional methionine sulfoxide reductase B/A protein [Sulfurovaceae bacterium]|nr:bifunctional methionine sulfoxide reductase B/A protein [Sulfurovaceae bacterium]